MSTVVKALIQGAACGVMLGLTLLVLLAVRPHIALAQPEIVPPPAPALVQEAVRAKRFEIVDEKGVTRIMLGVDKGNAYVILLDAAVKPRILLGQGEDGTGLVINDVKGVNRAILGQSTEDSFGLIFLDAAGKMRTLIGQGEKDGNNGLVLNDDAGKMRAVLGQWQNNPPVIYFQNSEGQPLWMAPMQNQGE